MNAVDICNKALAEIGHGKQIGDLYDGSPAATIAINLYGQARDDLLRQKDWPFASRTIALTLLKQASSPIPVPWNTTQPVPPWQYEYAYPSDCLYLRYVRPQPTASLGWDDNDPVPVLFKIANDIISNASTKVILSDTASALGIYTSQITDPTLWEPSFTQALIEALAQKFAVKLAEPASPPQFLDTILKDKLGEADSSRDAADARPY